MFRVEVIKMTRALKYFINKLKTYKNI